MAKGNRRDLLERNDIEVRERDKYTVHTLGKKKNSVAVAFVKAGKGDILVNNVPLALVRPEILRTKVSEPIMILGESLFKGLDMNIKVAGGGTCPRSMQSAKQSPGASLRLSRTRQPVQNSAPSL